METFFRTQVVKTERTRNYTVCDFCSKLLDVNFCTEARSNLGNVKRERVNYFHIFTCHSDWGGESDESGQCFDVCPKCIEKAFTAFLEQPSQTKNMDIESKTGFVPENWKEVPDLCPEKFKQKDFKDIIA